MPFMVGPIVGAVTEEGARCGRWPIQNGDTEPSQDVKKSDFPANDIMGAPQYVRILVLNGMYA